MSQNFPPPPYRQPIQDKNGYLTTAWAQWFQLGYDRAGGISALSNTELASSSQGTSTAVQAQITSLQTQINTISNQISGGLGAFNVGPVL